MVANRSLRDASLFPSKDTECIPPKRRRFDKPDKKVFANLASLWYEKFMSLKALRTEREKCKKNVILRRVSLDPEISALFVNPFGPGCSKGKDETHSRSVSKNTFLGIGRSSTLPKKATYFCSRVKSSTSRADLCHCGLSMAYQMQAKSRWTMPYLKRLAVDSLKLITRMHMRSKNQTALS